MGEGVPKVFQVGTPLDKGLPVLKLKRRDKSGTYYFRFIYCDKELARSLLTKDYTQAMKIAKDFDRYMRQKIEGQKYSFEEVREIFREYQLEANKCNTDSAFEAKQARHKQYLANNKIKNLNIGIYTELQLLNNLLSSALTPKNNAEKLKKLKQIKKQVKPIVSNYDEFATERHGDIVLEAHRNVIQNDALNFGVSTAVQVASVSVKEAYDLYITAKRSDGLKERPFQQVQSRLALCLNILTNYNMQVPLSEFGIFDFKRLREIVLDYPVYAHQNKILSSLVRHPEQLISTAKANGIKAIDIKTSSDTLRECNSFLNYCINNGLIQKNYLNFTMKDKNSPAKEKMIYDSTDIHMLMISPRFNKFEDTLRFCPEWIWIPLIAMFTGARLQEICQLHFEDIDLLANTIRISEQGTNKQYVSVKNTSSDRTVPLHDYLLSCGFRHFIENQAATYGANGNIWGFEITNVVVKYGWGRYFGKKFADYNRANITTNKNKSFHSFRHTVITYLNENYPESHIITEKLVGHMYKGTNLRTYTHAEWVSKLKELVNLIRYPDNENELLALADRMSSFYMHHL